MLFLLNDVVFDLDETRPPPHQDQQQFAYLELDALITLGCDLYAEDPLLHLHAPVRARRLAWLLAHHGEGINAAQFYAPEGGCDPILVEPRFCVLPQPVLRELRTRKQDHRPQTVTVSLADQLVWTTHAA